MRQPAEVRATIGEGRSAPRSRAAYWHLTGAARINASRLKRLFDIAAAGAALIVLSPLLIAIAITIRLDSKGPAIFRQVRNGRGGTFRILKFRTMTIEASAAPFEQAVRGDHRITRAGAWLRRTNLDELPQLINIFLGDMSVVGPRPHPPALDDWFAVAVPDLMLRYAVRPGLTGLAQVSGLRGETPEATQMAARVRADLEYVQTWSLWLDLRICWRTLFNRKAFENAR